MGSRAAPAARRPTRLHHNTGIHTDAPTKNSETMTKPRGTPARDQLEALEPLVVRATFQLLEDLQADPYSTTNTSKLDEKSCFFSIAISLRRIADKLDLLTVLKPVTITELKNAYGDDDE